MGVKPAQRGEASDLRASVRREAAGVSYRLRRSPRARRLRLVLDADGTPLVTLPVRAPARLADDFVASRRDWIGRQRQRFDAQRERHLARGSIGDGGTLEFSGQSHRIDVCPLAQGRRTRIEHDDSRELLIKVWLSPDDDRPLPIILEAWLRREARSAVRRRVTARGPQVGVLPVAVSIRDQRTRWGSASRSGRLSFSWRLVLAPPAVLDYVVVHELAHLVVFGHPPEFWALVRGVLPEADRARRWLRDHARELHWSLETLDAV
ncbi:MAG: SprT family zinc-dependent metalloprotease [Chloroflexi bacterium]|nr:SprT family zinc-dependent metalloprotease [Chloroflexota bacterium]